MEAGKYFIGFIIVTLLLSGVVYVSFLNQVKIRVDEDKTTFYVKNENNRWTVAGREYNRLIDGSSNMYRSKSNIELETIINESTNETWIIRTTPYIRGPVIIDEYYFRGDVRDVELFPISHKVTILNGSDFFYRYSVDDLTDTGDKRKLNGETELKFGKNMKVSFEPLYRWAWVGWPYGSDSFSAQYDINSDNETFNVRLFDPEPENIGYEFLDQFGNVTNASNGVTVRMWNDMADYFFDKDKGIQLTNHYEDYWTRNIFCLGYFTNNVNLTNKQFNRIKCADDFSSFNRIIDTDNSTYVTATLWKDFSHGPYDLRLGVKYDLVPKDEDLDVTIYVKNRGIDIPYDLGFEWRIEDWDIPPGNRSDEFFINGNYYWTDSVIDETFTEVDVEEHFGGSYFMGMDLHESLRLGWNENLDYEVNVDGNGIKEDFNVSLTIDGGHFNPGQEKSTTMQWLDDYADLQQHGDDYVLDDGVCGTNTNDVDDFLETFEVNSYQAQTLRFKYCITGQQDIPSNMSLFFSETTDNIGTWDNSSAPYFYPVGDQGSSAEIRWRDSPEVTHNATVDCIQTDDHSPEVGRVIEQNIPYPEFLSQPSANNKCQEHEIIIEHFGTDVGTWQISMAINGSNIADSGMHGREGIEYIMVAATTIPPQFSDNSTNGTAPGSWVSHNINITDSSGVNGYIFSFDNGTGTFVNDSFVENGGLQMWGNTTKFINETGGATIRFQWFSNDTAGNTNSSEIYQYTTSGYGTLDVVINSPIEDSTYYQYDTNLTINATVTCSGDPSSSCGIVYGTARYNNSGATPDTNVNLTEGDLPFYIMGNTSEKQRLITLTSNPGNFSYMNVSYYSNMNSNFSDVYFKNYDYTTEYNFTLQDKTDSDSAIFRINNLGETQFWMVYGNSSLGVSKSNVSATHYEPKSCLFLDEASGTNAIDSCGYMDGDTQGDVTVNQPSSVGTAYDFENTTIGSDYVLFTGFGTPASNSIVIRANLTEIPTSGWRFIWFGGQSNWNIQRIYFDTASNMKVRLGFYETDAFQPTILSDNEIVVNQEFVVGVTFGTPTMKMYIDGVLQADTNNTYSGDGVSGHTDKYIGSGTTQAFSINGTIDEYYYFDKELAAVQFAALSNYTTPGFSVGEEIVKENPMTSPSVLNQGESFTFYWELNVTTASVVNYLIDVFFNSSLGVSKVPNNDTDDITIKLNPIPPEDTCTYTTGDWNVLCSDNCVISSPVDLGGNDISITGTGTFLTTADISNYNLLHIEGTDSTNRCTVTCSGGGCFKD